MSKIRARKALDSWAEVVSSVQRARSILFLSACHRIKTTNNRGPLFLVGQVALVEPEFVRQLHRLVRPTLA